MYRRFDSDSDPLQCIEVKNHVEVIRLESWKQKSLPPNMSN